ncbi:MAG TPA: O-methyltransferase [Solirubrobacteraceae bacterium]|nr:O-methyltransferase [Solirubrobacteraceae bacterium]
MAIVLPVILTKAVDEYLATLRREPDGVLAEMEAQAERESIPVVPPETGELLGLLARIRGASRVVEIGTAIGVSTLYIARALGADGQVVSFEIDPARHEAARDYLQRAGLLDRVDLCLQDAREGLASLEGPFDMAFVDAAKMQYGDYIELLLPLLAPRAVMAIDNMLMSGTVATGRGDGNWTEDQIEMARALNARVVGMPEFDASLLPVGDGVLVAVRR